MSVPSIKGSSELTGFGYLQAGCQVLLEERTCKTVAVCAGVTAVVLLLKRVVLPYFATRAEPVINVLGNRCSPSVVASIKVTKEKFLEETHKVTEAVIFGHSLPMTFGSALTLFLQNDPVVVLNRAQDIFERINLDHLNALQCSDAQKTLLFMTKLVVKTKKCLPLTLTETLLSVGISYLAAKRYTQQLPIPVLERTGIALTTLAALGAFLKLYSWEAKIKVPLQPRAAVAQGQAQLPVKPLVRVPYGNPMQDCGDDFRKLPHHLLLMLVNYLPENDLDRVAYLNRRWRVVSFDYSVREKFLCQKFGKPLVEAFGRELHAASWQDIGTNLEEMGTGCTKTDWFFVGMDDRIEDQNHFYRNAQRCFEQNQSVNEITRAIKGHVSTNLLFKSLSADNKLQGTQLLHDHADIVSTKDGTVLPTPFIHFIKSENFVSGDVFKFRDAGSRYGVAFKYRLRVKDNPNQSLVGVAVLHQITHFVKEFIWIECSPVTVMFNDPGHFSLHRNEKISQRGRQIHRWFRFIYEVPKGQTSQTPVNLAWLKRFVKGDECGPLFFGGEFKNLLTMQFTAPQPSSSRLS